MWYGLRRGLRAYFKERAAHPDSKTERLLDEHRQELLGSTSHKSNIGFFKGFWKLSKPFWVNAKFKDNGVALILLTLSLAATTYSVREVAVGFNEWNGLIGNLIPESYNAIEKGQAAVDIALDNFFGLMQSLGVLTTQMLISGAITYKSGQLAVLRWRKWMTNDLEERWAKNKAFYHIQHKKDSIDNPDQRIQEDPAKFADAAVEIVTDAYDAALSFGTFSSILWGLSGSFNLAVLGGPELIIPKFMFSLVMGYSLIGTILTHYTGKSLEKWSQKQQMYEAIYRSDLINMRENAEQKALNDSENVQKGILTKSFNDLYDNYKKIINVKTNLLILKVIYHRLASVVPLVVTFPDVIAGKMQIGDIFKTMGAFGEVKNSMSWYVNNVPLIKQTKASMNRLNEFVDELKGIEEEQKAKQSSQELNKAPAPKATL